MERQESVQNLCWKTKGNKPLDRHKYRWKGNVKINNKDMLWEYEMDGSDLG
jgi:hypothetical protein